MRVSRGLASEELTHAPLRKFKIGEVRSSESQSDGLHPRSPLRSAREAPRKLGIEFQALQVFHNRANLCRLRVPACGLGRRRRIAGWQLIGECSVEFAPAPPN
jgi:hypothetical protein